MNKIFKVIWNHAAQRFVVTSELTKSNGKSSSSTDNRIEPSKALLAISVAGAALLGASNVDAATANKELSITTSSGAVKLYAASDNNGTAIGYNAKAESATNAPANSSTAIGYNANASSMLAIAIGPDSNASSTETVAIGHLANASNGGATAIGNRSEASGTLSVAIGQAKATKNQSTAIGTGAEATGNNAFALGSKAIASNVSTVGIGMEAKAQGANATAIGVKAAGDGENSISIGHTSGVAPAAPDGIAIGSVAKSNAERAIAIGRTAHANGTYSVAAGTLAIVRGSRSSAVGDSNYISSASSNVSVLGIKNFVGGTSTFDAATGLMTSAGLTDTTPVTNSKVVGNDNYITSSNTYVLGSGIGVKDDGSFFTTNTVENSVYLGNDSTITSSTATITAANAGSVKNLDKDGDAGATSTAGSKGTVSEAVVSTLTYGGFAGATSVGAVTVGSAGEERRIVNLAAGEISKTSTDAINGSQLYAVTEVIGKGINIQNNAGGDVANILPGEAIAFKDGNLTTANVTAVGGNVSVSFDVDKGTFNATQTGSLIANTADTGVATVADVANAVNSGYWSIGNRDANVDQVSFGDEVRFLNGTNTTVTVAKNGDYRTDVTYDTDFSKLPVANTDTTTITNDGDTIKVDVNTGNGSVGTDGTPNANNNASKVANISSVVDLVANVGWNVYQESITTARKDLVKAGDNLVFAKGANTTVSVETSDDGKTTTVKYDVDLANVNTAVKTGTVSSDATTGVASSDNTNGNIATVGDVANAINGSGWKTTLSNGNAEVINPGDTVNYVNGTTTIANVTKNGSDVNVAFEVNRTALTQDIAAGNDGKAVLEGTTTNGDNFVTAGDVINTINNVYWVATSGTDGGTYATSGHTKSDAQVKAGNTVTFKAGNGLTIKQEGMNFTYAVATGGLSSDTNKDNVTTTLGQAVPNTGSGNIATVGDVANAINNAGWVTKTTGGDVVVINPGDSVNYVDGKGTKANVTANADGGVNVTFDVDLPDTKVNGDAVSGDINFVNGNTTTVTNDNGKIKVEVNTGDSSVENGKAKSTTAADAAKVATVGDIVETINNVYHSVNSTAVKGTNGESTYAKTDDSQINAGDTVNYNAGKNIKISGSGNTFEFSTTDNVTFTNANVTGNLTVDGNTTVNNFTVKPDSKIDMGGNIISNVSSGVAPTDAVNVKQLHDAIGDATSSLVWKVTDNNNAANVTNVGNQTTVSFNNGEGTSAIVDGTNVTYNVNVDGTSTQITYVDKDGNSLTKNADGTYSKADGSAVDAKDVTGQVSVAFGEVSANTTTGVVSTPDTVEKVASTKDVRDAINGSGFTLTTSNSSTGAVSGTTSELINPGEVLTIDAGNNINITQSGNKVSVATSMTPTFTTVQVGGDSGPVISGDANGDVKVAKADGSAAKITNVAPGEVSRTSTDAVNGSQLYAVANGIDNKFGDIHNKINRNNKDLRAGVAGANAAAALPQVFKSGRSMVAASAGTFKGQSAVAVGYSRASDNGKLILKLQGNANSRGDVGGGVGVGYQW